MTKAIRLYAQVLVDVVLAPNSGFTLETILGELTTFTEVFNNNATFLKIFDNPTLADEEKQKILKEFLKPLHLSPLAERFLSILARRSRLGILADVITEVELLEIEKSGGLMGEIVSAVPLDDSVIASIKESLAKRLHKPVQLKQKVDPGIIAGMRVTVSGVTYDGSVRSKLDKLAGNL